MHETAYAKINLALHVRRRRDDGYHELETLFAFVDDGDRLSARLSDRDELRVTGEFASQLTDPFGNIVAQALGKLRRRGGLSIDLEKRLPVAAGLGGGSADAGAVFRIVREMHGLPDDWMQRAADLGADVPACVGSVACVGRGTGTQLEPAENDLAGTPVLLVNPRIPLSTGPVFKAWANAGANAGGGQDRGALPDGSASKIAHEGRNDLEAPAIQLCPPIAEVLAALRETGASLVRMSGSGATCFALYSHRNTLNAAAEMMRLNHPGWWQMQGRLR